MRAARGIDLAERLKQFGLIFEWDAGTGIRDVEGDHAAGGIGVPDHGDRDPAAFRKLDSIAGQVEQNLRERAPVGENGEAERFHRTR